MIGHGRQSPLFSHAGHLKDRAWGVLTDPTIPSNGLVCIPRRVSSATKAFSSYRRHRLLSCRSVLCSSLASDLSEFPAGGFLGFCSSHRGPAPCSFLGLPTRSFYDISPKQCLRACVERFFTCLLVELPSLVANSLRRPKSQLSQIRSCPQRVANFRGQPQPVASVLRRPFPRLSPSLFCLQRVATMFR